MSTFASSIYSAEDEPEELETVSIRGEYWFDDSGNTMYADGDVGDMGHEAHVIQSCIGSLASEFGLDAGDEPHLDTGGTLEQDILIKIAEDGEFVKKYLKLTDEEMETEDIFSLLDNDPASTMIEYLKDNTKMSPDTINGLVLNAYGSGDAREYAIKEWDWSRVQGDAIEVKELTADMLTVIARGIGNALDEEGLIYEYEDTPEVLDEHEYTISTYTGKRYTIKLKDMESGNVEGLERSDLEIKKSAATDQLRKMDVAAMPDFYKQKGVIGDSLNFNIVEAHDEKDVDANMFAQGYCAEFAEIFHQLTGFQIVSFDEVIDEEDDYYASAHYACKDGNWIYDCRGKRSEEAVAKNLYGTNGVPLTSYSLRTLSSGDLEAEGFLNDKAMEMAIPLAKKIIKTFNISSRVIGDSMNFNKLIEYFLEYYMGGATAYYITGNGKMHPVTLQDHNRQIIADYKIDPSEYQNIRKKHSILNIVIQEGTVFVRAFRSTATKEQRRELRDFAIEHNYNLDYVFDDSPSSVR